MNQNESKQPKVWAAIQRPMTLTLALEPVQKELPFLECFLQAKMSPF